MAGTVKGALESSKQLLGVWRAIVEDLGSIAKTEQEVAIRWAECSFYFFNSLTFDDDNVTQEALEKRLLFVSKYMRKSNCAGVFWLFEELLTTEAGANLATIYERTGLQKVSMCMGMAGTIRSLTDPSHLDLRFERARKQEHLDAFATLNAHAYGLPESDLLPVYQNSKLWLDRIYAYVGYQGDRPACCAGVIPFDGCLFVLMVATEPKYQRRGYGESVVRKALYEGNRATGLTRATLQATEAGRPVYERIGLEVTSIIQILQPTASRNFSD